MSLVQLHYATAAPGSGGNSPGFTAVSPGVPPALLAEAERLIGYEPPRDAPARPSDAELAALPTAFSHSALSDGSRLLARAVPTGAGRNGRSVAFHAHAVHLAPGEQLPGGALPITTWNSPRWAASTPADGAPAQLETLPASGLFYQDGQVGFAASRAPWLMGFFSGLRELIEEESAPPIVLVERRSADVAQWIALAGTVLPHDQAGRLTFTTYTRRPRTAPQQIIGVLPGDAHGLAGGDRRYRVLDCTEQPPAEPVTDVWARTAAHIWLGGTPGLFKEPAALPGGLFSPGPLAAVALCAGISPGSDGRAAAAGWAREYARELDGEYLRRLVDALCLPAEDRTKDEAASLARLFAELVNKVPSAVSAPLGVLVLTETVRAPDRGLDWADLRLLSLPDGFRQRLAAGLGPELRAGIAAEPADAGPDTSRPVELLHVAGLLGVDCADLLPGLAHRLSHALLTGPEAGGTPAVLTALDEHFELRVALLGTLDAFAAADPVAATRLLSRTALPFEGVQALPHLRMCAEAAGPSISGDDRLTALHTVLRAAGVSPFAEPVVLRTAFRLVWDSGTPTAAEARLMLGETGSDAHRGAGTWTVLVAAALDGPGDDPGAPDLAHDLLRSFPDELEPRVRGALRLLEFAGEVQAAHAQAGWTQRAQSLRAPAEPVEPGVLAQVFGAVARRLLSEERPDGELYALVHGGDPDLLAAYSSAARGNPVRDRLRAVPAYVADCFLAWSSLPGANRAWDETRKSLIDKVLRPVVRTLPSEATASVERILENEGPHHAREFRAWQRPGTLGRLGRRLGGLGSR